MRLAEREYCTYLESVGFEEAGHKFEIDEKDAAGATIYRQGALQLGRQLRVRQDGGGGPGQGCSGAGLAKYVRKEPAKMPPEGEKAIRALWRVAGLQVVLGGADSTVCSAGGWGPGFCADFTLKIACIDDDR